MIPSAEIEALVEFAADIGKARARWRENLLEWVIGRYFGQDGPYSPSQLAAIKANFTLVENELSGFAPEAVHEVWVEFQGDRASAIWIEAVEFAAGVVTLTVRCKAEDSPPATATEAQG